MLWFEWKTEKKNRDSSNTRILWRKEMKAFCRFKAKHQVCSPFFSFSFMYYWQTAEAVNVLRTWSQSHLSLQLPDVCYSWWVLASLKIIGRIHWIDKSRLRQFILACQDEETGGFADRPGDMVSYHTQKKKKKKKLSDMSGKTSVVLFFWRWTLSILCSGWLDSPSWARNRSKR